MGNEPKTELYNNCPIGREHQVELHNLKERMIELNKKTEELWDAVHEINEKLANRLPLWATFLLTLAAGVIGHYVTKK